MIRYSAQAMKSFQVLGLVSAACRRGAIPRHRRRRRAHGRWRECRRARSRAEARDVDRVVGDAVGAVAVEQGRVAAVELGVLRHHDRERHLDAVARLHPHFPGDDAVGRAERAGLLQAGVDESIRLPVVRVEAEVVRPRADREHDAGHAQVARCDLERAFARQGDELGLRAGRVGQPVELAERPVAADDVERVLRRLDVDHDLLAGCDHDLGVRQVGMREAGLEHLEAQRVFVRQQVQILAVNGEVGDVLRAVEELSPLRRRGRHLRLRRDVGGDLVLDAVAWDGNDIGRSDHGRDVRELGRPDLNARRRAGFDHLPIGSASLHAVEERALALVLLRLRRPLVEKTLAKVEETAVVGHPVGAAVMGPADRLDELFQARDIEDVDRRFLGAALRHAVGQVPAARRRRVEGHRVRRAGGLGLGLGIDQQPACALQAMAHVDLVLVVGGAALFVEVDVVRQPPDGADPRRHRSLELGDARQQRGASRDGIEHRTRVLALRLHPVYGRRGESLHVAIVVGDRTPHSYSSPADGATGGLAITAASAALANG